MKLQNLKQNKQGKILPRDVIFMILIFSGIIAFSSILVNQMGDEYGNTEMTNSYNQDAVGSSSLSSNAETWKDIGEDLSGSNGIKQMLKGALTGIGNILLKVLEAPITFANMLTSTLGLVGASEDFQNIAGIFIAGLLYVIIIFGIVQVFLRGGEV